MDVDKVVAQLRQRLAAENDTDLAKKLGISKSTISTWRQRGAVPTAYTDLLDGQAREAVAKAPTRWGENDNYAFELAMFRFVRAMASELGKSTWREVFDAFEPSTASFWMLMLECQRDLAADHLKGNGRAPSTSFMLLFAEYHDAGEVQRKQDRKLLLEWMNRSADQV